MNKKYDMKLNETKELKGELLDEQQRLSNKENELHKVETDFRRNQHRVLTLKKELGACKNMFLPHEQGAEFERIVSRLTVERTKVEEQYFRLRKDLSSALNMLDVSRIKAEEVGKLLDDLKGKKPTELSDKLISMSEDLQGARLATRKAERKADQLEEVNAYLSNLLNSRTNDV